MKLTQPVLIQLVGDTLPIDNGGTLSSDHGHTLRSDNGCTFSSDNGGNGRLSKVTSSKLRNSFNLC